jgi:predicted permease
MWQDAAHALRLLRKNLGFALTAALIGSLGIGGTTAMFSVIHSVLLKPLAYRDSARLVRLSLQATIVRYDEFRNAAGSYEGVGAFVRPDSVTLSGGAEPEVLRQSSVTANVLDILGVAPSIGRSFLPEEDNPDGPRVAMISAGLWQRRFGSDPEVLGKTLALDTGLHTIIGVMPPHFAFPVADTDIWVPRAATIVGTPTPSQLQSPVLTVFGRLKPGITLAQADAELNVLRAQYGAAHPGSLDARPNTVDSVVVLKEQLVGSVRSMLWMLFGAVGFVLLIACANIAALLAARGNSRAREFAIRASLGAGRARLVRQLLVESALLGVIAGAFGLLLADWIVNAIRGSALFTMPRAEEIAFDPAVLGFAGLVSLGTGLLFGLLPAFSAASIEPATMLRARSCASRGGRLRGLPGMISARALLVAGQVALSVILLIGTTLLIESIARMHTVDPGFNSDRILTLQISPAPNRYNSSTGKIAFFEEVLRRIHDLPGVQNAALTLTVPLDGWIGRPVQPADRQLLKLNERQITIEQNITPDYFRALGIPLRRGREFNAGDGPDTAPVVIISESLARRFWPDYPNGEDPLGHELLLGLAPKPSRIVGIVGDVMTGFDADPLPEMYRLYEQNATFPFASLIIKSQRDPAGLIEPVRKAVLSVDPNQPITDVKTMDQLVDESIGQRRAVRLLLEIFAGIAVLLAITGIYGLLAYSVTQRTSEIGLRMALGAEAGSISKMFLAESVAIAAAGISAGLIGAYVLTRFLKTFLFRISPTDPSTFVAIALFFTVAAVIASWLPVRRASRIDPAVALRRE